MTDIVVSARDAGEDAQKRMNLSHETRAGRWELMKKLFWKIHLYFTIRHRLRLELLIVDIIRLFRYG